uniref:MPN domain-containing protein n=1 Tax=Plectus sambesii TaxID=2011161 RepID=A0A914XPA6_9BILA
MASTMTVKVHPVVYFTIVDAFERRSNKEGANDKALGTLLGFYEKNGVQVTNCYSIPFSEQKEEAPELDDGYNQQMLQMMKRASPTEGPVGWFYTNADLSTHCLSYHDYYNRLIGEHQSAKKETPPVILLTVDTTFSGPNNRMGVRAYLRTKAGIPGNREPHCAIFNPIKVEMDAFPAERVALELIQGGTDSKQREVHLQGGIDQLTKATEEMLVWVDRLREYVDEVLAGKRDMDASMGRKLMDLVTSASSHMQPKKFENVLKNSMRDYMMISYLAQLAKTQLALHERMISA